MTVYGLRIWLRAVLLWLGIALCAAAEVTTVAVLDFAPTQDGPEFRTHRWLSKAFADLLIGDLGTDSTLRIVTRENMRMLMQEADLREHSGLTADRIDPGEHRRMQQYLRVDHLVFGAYTIAGDTIRVQAAVIDHASGEQLAQFVSEGALREALALEKELAYALLRYYRAGELDDQTWDLPRWTDSMEAAERLYEGVDAYDEGLYTQAWYAFRQAATTDRGYADAFYWAARMYYYRQDYAHAQLAYRDFIQRFPNHPRISDAVAEYVHSMESGALMTTPLQGGGAEQGADANLELDGRFTPEQALALYRSLRKQDWGDAHVNNKVTYASRSPLADWLMKREQQALVYLGRLPEAFALLETGLESLPDDPVDAMARSWREESQRLMAAIAMESEDAGGPRLASPLLTTRDHYLTLDDPVIAVDLSAGFTGNQLVWGPNYRMLAPPGYAFDTVRTEIFRTNDTDADSICRLQIRRYRYVDIDSCWTSGKGPNAGKRYTHTIRMPRGITWFYLRPEYDGRQMHAKHSSFDGWRLEAGFKPIAEDAGGILVDVQNAFQHETLIDGVYTRSYNGVIGNLSPGSYSVRVRSLWGGRTSRAFEDYEEQLEVRPGEFTHLRPSVRLQADLRAAGWNDPVGIATHYPTYKHRPRPDSNLLSGPPSVHIDPRTGQYLAVWSHLDTLWMSRSPDGLQWEPPEILPAPVNSADAEVNPRIIRDNQGRYCLTFLSNRGMSRNLAAYVAWSRDLRYWSRPIMLDAQHHDDLDLMQDSEGRYLLLQTPSATSPDGGQEQPAMISLRASYDLIDWEPAVDPAVWEAVFYPFELPTGKERAVYVKRVRPRKARMTQDSSGIYHLVWFQWDHRNVMRTHSHNLTQWSMQERVPYSLSSSPYNIAIATDHDRVHVALSASDERYSGAEIFTIVSGPLRSQLLPGSWKYATTPHATISGISNMAYDTHRNRLTMAWLTADQTLHPTRLSGPVYIMTGDPALSRPAPVKFDAVHTEMGARLDHIIGRIGGSDADGWEAERKEAATHWADYERALARTGRAGQRRIVRIRHGALADPNEAMHFVNACRMSFIDLQQHGWRPLRHPTRQYAFQTLQEQVNATGGSGGELTAYMVSAIYSESPFEALQAYHALVEEDSAWARHALRLARVIVNQADQFGGQPAAVATSTWLLSMAGTQLPDVVEPQDR